MTQLSSRSRVSLRKQKCGRENELVKHERINRADDAHQEFNASIGMRRAGPEY